MAQFMERFWPFGAVPHFLFFFLCVSGFTFLPFFLLFVRLFLLFFFWFRFRFVLALAGVIFCVDSLAGQTEI